jgi:hypothetical protein
MRGVGAAERAVGNAWGRMTSRQREYYGNQRNFASGLQGIANERGAAKEADDRESSRQRGFDDATGQSANSRAIAAKSTPPASKTDHSTEVMPTQEELFAQRTAKRRQNDMARMKTENPDRYKRINDAVETDSGVPRIKPGWQDKPDLEDAMNQGRVGGNRRPDPESAPESAPAAPKPITGRTPESDDVGRRMALALAARRDNRKTQYAIDTAYAEHNVRESTKVDKGLKETRGFDMGQVPMKNEDLENKRRPMGTDDNFGSPRRGADRIEYTFDDWNVKLAKANKYQNRRVDPSEFGNLF